MRRGGRGGRSGKNLQLLDGVVQNKDREVVSSTNIVKGRDERTSLLDQGPGGRSISDTEGR